MVYCSRLLRHNIGIRLNKSLLNISSIRLPNVCSSFWFPYCFGVWIVLPYSMMAVIYIVFINHMLKVFPKHEYYFALYNCPQHLTVGQLKYTDAVWSLFGIRVNSCYEIVMMVLWCWNCVTWYNLGINSSPPSAAYMRRWTGSALGQIMDCHLYGAMSFSKPLLGSSQMDP